MLAWTQRVRHRPISVYVEGRGAVYKYNPSLLPLSLYTITVAISRGFIINIRGFAGASVSLQWRRFRDYSCTHNIYIEIHPTAITATHLSLKRLALYVLIISSISLLFIQYFDTWPKQLYEDFSGVTGMWNSLRQSENNTDNYRPIPSLTAHARDKQMSILIRNLDIFQQLHKFHI